MKRELLNTPRASHQNAMKIVHLISSGGFYGAENMLLTLLEHSLEHHVDVSLCILGGPPDGVSELAHRTRLLGIAVTHIVCDGRFDITAIRSISQHLRGSSATILHTHGYKADILGYLATIGNSCSIIATCHNWTKASHALTLYSVLDKLALSIFDHVVAVSPKIAEELLRGGISTSRLSTIANGVRLSEDKLALLQPQVHVLTVGMATRLVEDKGIGDLLQAAGVILQQQRSVRFLIAGDGPLRSKFEQQAAALGISASVTFLGFVKDMRSFFCSLDIFVLPSLREGLPMSILEAMALGKPVIATTVGAIPNVIVDDESGLLIKPEDVAGLQAKLSHLIQNDALRSRLGNGARLVIEARYSAAIMADAYLERYRSLMPQCPRDNLSQLRRNPQDLL